MQWREYVLSSDAGLGEGDAQVRGLGQLVVVQLLQPIRHTDKQTDRQLAGWSWREGESTYDECEDGVVQGRQTEQSHLPVC